MRIPRTLIDVTHVAEIDMGGRGGKEQLFSTVLPKWQRVSAALYDYEIDYRAQNIRLEVKKQRNLQWFDSGKYFKLAASDRDIRKMFVIHEDGAIVLILVALMGEMIDWLCKNRKKDGWTDEVLKVGAEYKKRYPTLQFKAQVHVRTIYEENPQLFDVVYRKG